MSLNHTPKKQVRRVAIKNASKRLVKDAQIGVIKQYKPFKLPKGGRLTANAGIFLIKQLKPQKKKEEVVKSPTGWTPEGVCELINKKPSFSWSHDHLKNIMIPMFVHRGIPVECTSEQFADALYKYITAGDLQAPV